jgi:hypothetical protein
MSRVRANPGPWPSVGLGMKYLGPIDIQAATVPQSSGGDAAGVGWQLEELGAPISGPVTGPSSRWLALVVGVAVAAIGFGFAGHGSDASVTVPPSAAAPANVPGPSGPTTDAEQPAPAKASLEIVAPVAGTVISTPIVDVHAIATRPLGTVHLAVTLGDAVLGWRTITVADPGPVDVAIPVFAPTFEAPVTLTVSAGSTSGTPRFSIDRSFAMRIPLSAGIWAAAAAERASSTDVRIRGFAPLSAETVGVELLDRDGHRLAATTASIAYDAGLPGSLGGRMLELGSFDPRLTVVPAGRRPWTVRVTWRDVTSGLALHIDSNVDPDPAAAHTVTRRR